MSRPGLFAAGGFHSLVISERGDLYAWGFNTHGQIGDGTYENKAYPLKVWNAEERGKAFKVAAGRLHTLLIAEDGVLWAWGSNEDGILGTGTEAKQITPKQVIGGGVQAVAGGWYHTLALTEDGDVLAWGNNKYGQLGDGSTEFRTAPIKVLCNTTAVAAGAYHSVALTAAGEVLAWGFNASSQTCHEAAATPRVILVDGVRDIAAGAYHSLAVMEPEAPGQGGRLLVWGSNEHGQLGDGTATRRLHPVEVASDVVRASAGDFCTAAVTSKLEMSVWGFALGGRPGTPGEWRRAYNPEVLHMKGGAHSVACGSLHVVVLDPVGEIFSWGSNAHGQVGDASETDQCYPISVMKAYTVEMIPRAVVLAALMRGPDEFGDNTVKLQQTRGLRNKEITYALAKPGLLGPRICEDVMKPTDKHVEMHGAVTMLDGCDWRGSTLACSEGFVKPGQLNPEDWDDINKKATTLQLANLEARRELDQANGRAKKTKEMVLQAEEVVRNIQIGASEMLRLEEENKRKRVAAGEDIIPMTTSKNVPNIMPKLLRRSTAALGPLAIEMRSSKSSPSGSEGEAPLALRETLHDAAGGFFARRGDLLPKASRLPARSKAPASSSAPVPSPGPMVEWRATMEEGAETQMQVYGMTRAQLELMKSGSVVRLALEHRDVARNEERLALEAKAAAEAALAASMPPGMVPELLVTMARGETEFARKQRLRKELKRERKAAEDAEAAEKAQLERVKKASGKNPRIVGMRVIAPDRVAHLKPYCSEDMLLMVKSCIYDMLGSSYGMGAGETKWIKDKALYDLMGDVVKPIIVLQGMSLSHYPKRCVPPEPNQTVTQSPFRLMLLGEDSGVFYVSELEDLRLLSEYGRNQAISGRPKWLLTLFGLNGGGSKFPSPYGREDCLDKVVETPKALTTTSASLPDLLIGISSMGLGAGGTASKAALPAGATVAAAARYCERSGLGQRSAGGASEAEIRAKYFGDMLDHETVNDYKKRVCEGVAVLKRQAMPADFMFQRQQVATAKLMSATAGVDVVDAAVRRRVIRAQFGQNRRSPPQDVAAPAGAGKRPLVLSLEDSAATGSVFRRDEY